MPILNPAYLHGHKVLLDLSLGRPVRSPEEFVGGLTRVSGELVQSRDIRRLLTLMSGSSSRSEPADVPGGMMTLLRRC